MNRIRPSTMILIGFLFVLFGFLVPFLTVLKVIPSNFFFLFLSFTTSVAGLMLGIVGAASLSRHD